jgi:hypothetical protein
MVANHITEDLIALADSGIRAGRTSDQRLPNVMTIATRGGDGRSSPSTLFKPSVPTSWILLPLALSHCKDNLPYGHPVTSLQASIESVKCYRDTPLKTEPGPDPPTSLWAAVGGDKGKNRVSNSNSA